ncbi:MAG: OmpA family protein [Bacteroidales bacterium]|jgi:outer membrane protein OmpA-like peptidoglycan-associated protein|nr:OmpA family protein [Bacteroidales bacterium]
MKNFVLTAVVIIFYINSFSQNLVPNHSFEEAWTCPEGFVPEPVGKPYPGWLNPNNGTPDIFHACSETGAGVPDNFAGNIYPYDGSGYAGLVLWEQFFSIRKGKEFSFISREYIQTRLKEPLKRNKLYCVKLQYANAGKSIYSIDALGVALTKEKISSRKGSLIIQRPQIINRPGHIMENTGNWEEFCGTYRAKGNEAYLTIGNFWDNSQTQYKENRHSGTDSALIYAYYFIDDVRVFEIDNSFECGCHNDFSFGSDWLADDYDQETGYNSIRRNAGDLADNRNNSNNEGQNINSGNDSNLNNNSSGNGNNLVNSGDDNNNNNLNQGNGTGQNGNDNKNSNDFNDDMYGMRSGISDPLALKKSEISENAFSNAKIGDKFNLNRIFFEFNSSELLTVSYHELDRLFEILDAKPSLRIEIRGHTDDIGTSQYNKTLSVKRAESVYNYLSLKGIEKARMKYRGFGNTVPVSDNNTEEGRSMNRRVEIIIVNL